MPSGTTASGTASRKDLAWAAALISALLSLTLYTSTLVPEVGWGDAAEFALQAAKLGVTHPPGSPVHTFLGKLFCLAAADPAFGTNLLSAVCTCIAVALLNLICFELTGNWYAGLVAGAIFAVCPRVWEMAVITEVYNVNVCLLTLALFLVVLQQGRPSAVLPCTAAIVFGISLGAYLANLLLLPGFVYMAAYNRRNKLLAAVLFVSLVAAAGAVSLSWSHYRARECPPLGTPYSPDTLGDFALYLTGRQYGTTILQSPAFYLNRITEHALVFARSFAWIGAILGLCGFMYQWKTQRPMCVGLLLVFVANMTFFTGYGRADYTTMVTPSYLVFSSWIAHCIDRSGKIGGRVTTAVTSAVLPLAVVAFLLYMQVGPRAIRSRQTQVTDLVMSCFRVIPANALVIADWPEFTPLLYFQNTYGLRRDLAIIEWTEDPRHYTFGTIPDWRSYSRAKHAGRTIAVCTPTAGAPECYKVNWADADRYSFERYPPVPP